MAGRKQGEREEGGHRFGGDWTETKLEILRGYLEAYTTALKEQSFSTGYIDAFAGTGYRTPDQPDEESQLAFPDLAAEAPQQLLEGSARIALRVEPKFDGYVFVERSRNRCEQLAKLKEEFPALADKIQIRNGEANKEIQKICRRDWSSRRAVLFLDPYGLQVEWKTVEMVAATGAIDLWLLFPLGIGVNRLLPRTGQIPERWRQALNRLLGTEDWFEAFYRVETRPSLFGEEMTLVKEGVDTIGQYFVNRLKTVFPGVAPQPKVLFNASRCPLYLFCFAVSSQSLKAQGIALKIANHLLKKV